MITIFKNKNHIPPEMDYVELNDIYFNQYTASKLDERANKVIEIVDNSKKISKYKICSRFDDSILNIDQLSTGCKTILNVLYFPDTVFCMKECGNNALSLLYQIKSGNVFSDYALIPFDMKSVNVQTKSEKKVISNYESLKEWWEDEE